jgi:hypothetical protein
MIRKNTSYLQAKTGITLAIKKILLILFLVFFGTSVKAQTPDLNEKIISFVESKINARVGSGDCWDLAKEVLTANNCKWDGQYEFGKLINPRKDTVYPGDFIQFYNVQIQYNKNDTVVKEQYPRHTAIVYQVKPNNEYVIAHQNCNHIKLVTLSGFKLSTIRTGYVKFYRPIEK